MATMKTTHWKTISLTILITMMVTAVAVYFIVRWLFFPAPFETPVLSQQEQQQLSQKLDSISPGLGQSFASTLPDELPSGQSQSGQSQSDQSQPAGSQPIESTNGHASQNDLLPEPYSESAAARHIQLSERELNSLLAHNTNWSDKVALDLSQNLISIKVLAPLDSDLPFVGGKTLRLRSGLDLQMQQGNLVAILKGVSIMGVPMPNEWLGNLKNTDLMEQVDDGFWQQLAAGIEAFSVQDGQLSITLKP